MTTRGPVLIVDDREDQRWEQRALLEREGFAVEEAATRDAAEPLLATHRFPVAVLDINLTGVAGDAGGVELLSQLPLGVRGIVVSGVATRDAVREAFARGAFDFVAKDEYFDTMLPIKVRHALELAERELLIATGIAQRETQLLTAWASCLNETHSQRKGALLEEVVRLVFASIPGFAGATSNRRNGVEEFDVSVRNDSTDPFWRDQGNFLLVEAKHWSQQVDVRELSHFQEKLRARFGQTKLGFFVAWSGFTGPTREKRLALAREPYLVVLLTKADLQALVTLPPAQRSEGLKVLVDKAVHIED